MLCKTTTETRDICMNSHDDVNCEGIMAFTDQVFTLGHMSNPSLAWKKGDV